MHAMWTKILASVLATLMAGASPVCACLAMGGGRPADEKAAKPAPASHRSDHACCAEQRETAHPAQPPASPHPQSDQPCESCDLHQRAEQMTSTNAAELSHLIHELAAITSPGTAQVLPASDSIAIDTLAARDTEPILLQDLFHLACLLTV